MITVSLESPYVDKLIAKLGGLPNYVGERENVVFGVGRTVAAWTEIISEEVSVWGRKVKKSYTLHCAVVVAEDGRPIPVVYHKCAYPEDKRDRLHGTARAVLSAGEDLRKDVIAYIATEITIILRKHAARHITAKTYRYNDIIELLREYTNASMKDSWKFSGIPYAQSVSKKADPLFKIVRTKGNGHSDYANAILMEPEWMANTRMPPKGDDEMMGIGLMIAANIGIGGYYKSPLMVREMLWGISRYYQQRRNIRNAEKKAIRDKEIEQEVAEAKAKRLAAAKEAQKRKDFEDWATGPHMNPEEDAAPVKKSKKTVPGEQIVYGAGGKPSMLRKPLLDKNGDHHGGFVYEALPPQEIVPTIPRKRVKVSTK